MSTTRLWVVVAVLALLNSGVVIAIIHANLLKQDAVDQLRTARIKSQRLNQQLDRLQSVEQSNTRTLFADSLQSLQVEILAIVDELSSELSIDTVTVRQSLFRDKPRAFPDEKTVTIRTAVSMRVSHALMLIDFTEAIAESIVEWPLEIRACDIKRQAEVLSATCALDVYHWAFVETEGG